MDFRKLKVKFDVWSLYYREYIVGFIIGLIVGGFCLFLYSQHKIRQCDIEFWRQQQLHKSFMKHKK